ncbi:DUF4352 domain-containing protein [Lysinibacillus pakistanensis]|uniref:DUF4352 domain-containing protein n=1 Tax=Lysinibacillus pakistanensis TaxID=759811 RepID=A0AAX3X030_9BACI|nr:DUF4352 domain-containing protein [Lysinibacillus pakistanensis]MDM5231499.1 DUF4352 domain-containing protein [Lysinibacillus pakistanensis]WHY47046.1 DUF4352 domain-containing protein [Lysinibacillus pakistanensis]WHY52057.1 DUF4352 domain-containing protein [Lysinibacillus pakistanensis]
MKKLFYIGALSTLLLAACGEEAAPKEKDTTQSVQAEAEKSKTLTVGDTAEFKDAKFTLKAVSTTDARNEFDETKPNQVIKIEYELENLAKDELSYGMDLTVYDGAGNKMESYALDNSMGAVASGKKVQGVQHFGIMEGGKIEIHYAPIISFDDAAVFEVEVK